MKIKWFRKTWQPWGTPIGQHWEFYYRNGTRFTSAIYPEGTERLCLITRHRTNGHTHYTVGHDYPIKRATSLCAAIELADKIISREVSK